MVATSHPRARLTGISSVDVSDSLVLYGKQQGHYHALNANATAVWRSCDGTRSVAEIAAFPGEPVELVAVAVSDSTTLDFLIARPTVR